MSVREHDASHVRRVSPDRREPRDDPGGGPGEAAVDEGDALVVDERVGVDGPGADRGDPEDTRGELGRRRVGHGRDRSRARDCGHDRGRPLSADPDPAQRHARFTAARVARLATLRADGTARLVPMTFVLVDGLLCSAVDELKPKRTRASLASTTSGGIRGSEFSWTTTRTTGPRCGGCASTAWPRYTTPGSVRDRALAELAGSTRPTRRPRRPGPSWSSPRSDGPGGRRAGDRAGA